MTDLMAIGYANGVSGRYYANCGRWNTTRLDAIATRYIGKLRQMVWIHSCVDKFGRWNATVTDVMGTVVLIGVV